MMRATLLGAVVLAGCGPLGGGQHGGLPKLNELRLRDNLGQCDAKVHEVLAHYPEAQRVMSLGCTYLAVESTPVLADACGAAIALSEPVADLVNQARPLTPVACEGLYRHAVTLDTAVKLVKQAAWTGRYWIDVAAGERPETPRHDAARDVREAETAGEP